MNKILCHKIILSSYVNCYFKLPQVAMLISTLFVARLRRDTTKFIKQFAAEIFEPTYCRLATLHIKIPSKYLHLPIWVYTCIYWCRHIGFASHSIDLLRFVLFTETNSLNHLQTKALKKLSRSILTLVLKIRRRKNCIKCIC